jgi:DNA-binding NarL/FixJ family response regulator
VTRWQALGAAFEVARARALLSRACDALGDSDGALLEARAAREVLTRLGAADVALLEPDGPRGPLSERELEVLRLVARGSSNRTIAAELVIAEKTVARHLSNIFTKLDVGSRSAATAYASEHGMVEPTG